MRKVLRSGLACYATGLVAVSLSPAAAQGLLPDRPDVAGGRAQPAYDAEGVSVGTMVAQPKLGVTLGYDSNLFGEATGVSRDNFVVVSPALTLRTDWGIDGVALAANGDFTRWFLFPTQNTDEFGVKAGGRINLGEATVSLSVDASRRAERKGENGVPLSRIAPSFANDFGQSLSLRHASTPFQLGVSVSHRNTTYSDVAGLSQRFRDSESFGADVSATYVPSDIAAVGIVVGYDHSRPAEDNGRSNNNLSVRGTLGLDFGMFRLQGTVGYLQKHYTNSRFADYNGIVYNVSASWYPTALLSLTGTFNRSLQNSGNPEVGTIVGESIRVQIDYELLRNVILTADFGRKRQFFREDAGSALANSGEISANFKFNRIVAIGAYGRWECKDAEVIDTVRHYCTDLAGLSLTLRR